MKKLKFLRRHLALGLCGCLLLTGCGQAAPAEPDAAPPAATEAAAQSSPETAAATEAPDSVTTLIQAQYPEMAPYPQFDPQDPDNEGYQEASSKWYDSIAAQRREDGYADSLDGFWQKVLPVFLDGNGGENRVVSPVNLYMACAMLAQVTGGESRNQILAALGQTDLDHLKAQVSDVWNAQYCNDGVTTSILSNSLWLSHSYNYDPDTVKGLADSCYASVYSGAPGSPAMDQAFTQWLNAATGDQLQDQIADLHLPQELVVALASALNYKARWQIEFDPNRTQDQTFFDRDQGMVPFLHMDYDTNYFEAESFDALSLVMANNGGTLWLLRPGEGIPPEALLTQEDTMDFLRDPFGWEEDRYLTVHLSLPKFDISAQGDLMPGLQTLGITEVFMPQFSDFSPLMADDQKVFLSQASQGLRFALDEEGVTAASYAIMMGVGAGAPPEEEVDFTLDHPFLFVLKSPDGLPMFAGIVNQL